jgi:hypothetical protein
MLGYLKSLSCCSGCHVTIPIYIVVVHIKSQNMCSKIMVIKYKNTPFKPHKRNQHVMENISWLPIKNKWPTINNTTIYASKNASKDNVSPCEIIIYYITISTLTNNPRCITSKLNTFTIHDVMMGAFKWSIIIQIFFLQTYLSWPIKKLLVDLHSKLTIKGLLPSLNKNYATII